MGCRGIFGRRSMTPDLLIRTGLRQGRLWLGAGILACIAGVVALQFAATGLVHGNAILQDLGQHGVTAGKGWAVVGVALVASVLQWLRSRREALPSGPFLLAASVLAVLIYAGYARAFDLQWINDFADMWRLAVQEVAQGQFNAECAIPEVAACHLKAQRTLPILWPAVYLWGHRASLVPLLNGGLLLLMMLMGWDQARSAFGPRAAQVFAVLWVGCAETVFALRIPTHDLWGLFFIALLSWLLVRWFRQAQGVGRSLVYGVALAVPVLLLEVQRELGLVALAALTCTVLLLRGHRPLQRSLACALLACTLAYAGGMAGLKHADMLADDGETAYLSRLRTFALIPAYSGATWLYGQVLGDSMLRPLPAPAQRELARAAVLSDFAEQPLMRIAGVAFKASQLAPLGNQTYFYQPGLQQDRPGLFGGFEAYNRLYCVLLAALVLAALLRVLRRPLELAVAFPLAFMGVLIGGLLTVGETQTRYLFPLWFFAPLVVASGFGQAPRGEAAVAVAPQPMARALLVGALSFHLIEDPIRQSSWLEPSAKWKRMTSWQRFDRASRIVAVIAIPVAAMVIVASMFALNRPSQRPETPTVVEVEEPGSETSSTGSEAELEPVQASIIGALNAEQWPAEIVQQIDSGEYLPTGLLNNQCLDVKEATLDECQVGDPTLPRRAVVLGDSVALSWMPGLGPALNGLGYQVQLLSHSQCPAADVSVSGSFGEGAVRPGYPKACNEHRAWALDQVDAAKPDLVFIADGEAEMQTLMLPDDTVTKKLYWQQGMERTLDRLDGSKVVILASPPQAESVTECYTRVASVEDCTGRIDKQWREQFAAAAAAVEAKGSDAALIDTQQWFCSVDGWCPPFALESVIRSDRQHLTQLYASRLAPLLRERIREIDAGE